MELPQGLQNELLKKFKSQKNITLAVKQCEIYNFDNFNINQIQKIFGKSTQKIFAETNSKKHLKKVFDMIKTYFYNGKTSNYFNLYFSPTNNLEEYNLRRSFISSLNFEKFDDGEIKKIFSLIEPLKKKVSMNFNLLTLDASTENLLYEKYGLNCELLSKKELAGQEQASMFDKTSVLITQDEVFIEIPTYTIEEFERIVIGNLIKINKVQILNLLDFLSLIEDEKKSILEVINSLSNLDFNFNFDKNKLRNILEINTQEHLKLLTSQVLCFDEKIVSVNKKIKDIISKKQLSLKGDELLEMLNSGDMGALQDKFKADTKQIIEVEEKLLLEEFQKAGIKMNFLFSNHNYPLTIDEEIKNELLEKIDDMSSKQELELQTSLGEFSFSQISSIVNFSFFFDMFFGMKKFEKKFNLVYPVFGDGLQISSGKNIYLDNPNGVDYVVGAKKFKDYKFKGEKVGILTGANSGGKTTLLEMILQMQIVASFGFGISAESISKFRFFDEVIYLKKFTGTQGSGAFEQTIRYIIDILNRDTSKLILIDEFEAVTEPGAAAKILISFLTEINKQNSFCIAASHLGVEISSFIEKEKISGIRIDGISAQGLDEKGYLITNHQPQFYTLGKSTPELILKRILQDDKFWKDKDEKIQDILKNML